MDVHKNGKARHYRENFYKQLNKASINKEMSVKWLTEIVDIQDHVIGTKSHRGHVLKDIKDSDKFQLCSGTLE